MSRDKFINLINKATQQYNLPAGLLDGVIQRESAFNPQAKSPAGAMGLMQLMPGTAKDLGVTDPYDPEQSIMGGANYLSQQLKAFDNDPKLALAAYNAGPGNVQKYGGIPPFKETQSYVPKVLEAAAKFGYGAPAQPEVSPQSPIQSLMSQMPEPMGMDQMKSMVGLDGATLGRRNKMNFIGSILNGLAQVTGSFNPNRGAALQKMYSDQNQNNLKLQAAQKESAIANLMKLVERNTTKNPMLTDDIKEYTFAAQNGFKGGFEEWMKQKSSGNEFNQLLALEKFKYQKSRDDEQRKIRDQEKTNNDIKNLSKDLSGMQELQSALHEVERSLGFNIDDYNPNNATVEGKKVNLPGFNLPGWGRVTAHSTKARELDSSIKRIYNTILKERSGAAVTNPEFARFITEFEAGKFNTEEEIIRGLQRFKRGLAIEMKNKEAAYKPEVLEEYRSRGADTSKNMLPNQGSPIQKIMSGQGRNSPAAVPNRQSNQLNKFKNMSDEELMKLAAERWGE